jgi:hypothetical protein
VNFGHAVLPHEKLTLQYPNQGRARRKMMAVRMKSAASMLLMVFFHATPHQD